MKPNDEQVLAIRLYLRDHLKYSETKDEMFDHILTALEYAPLELSFGEAMNGVIKDIGGLKGIAKIERAAKMAAIRAMLTEYLGTLKQVCRSSFIIAIAAIAITAYYLLNRFELRPFAFWLSLTAIMNIPSFAIKRNIFRAPNLVNVKNDAFKTIYAASYAGIMLLLILVMCFSSVMLIIYTGAFSIVSIHGAVLYKLTRKELKVKLSDNNIA